MGRRYRLDKCSIVFTPLVYHRLSRRTAYRAVCCALSRATGRTLLLHWRTTSGTVRSTRSHGSGDSGPIPGQVRRHITARLLSARCPAGPLERTTGGGGAARPGAGPAHHARSSGNSERPRNHPHLGGSTNQRQCQRIGHTHSAGNVDRHQAGLLARRQRVAHVGSHARATTARVYEGSQLAAVAARNILLTGAQA